MSDSDIQTPSPEPQAPAPTLADLLASPDGQVALSAVTIADTMPHLTTGESKRLFAYNAITEANPSLSRSDVYFLIELAVKHLKEDN